MHRLAPREVPAANHEASARPTAVRISPIDGSRVQFCRQRHASIMAISEGKHERRHLLFGRGSPGWYDSGKTRIMRLPGDRQSRPG